MKRIAHIDGTTIINVSIAADDAVLGPNMMLESEALAAGYTYKVTDKASGIVVSMRSFREACGRELMIQINAYVASIEDLNERFKAQTDLEFATTVARSHPRVAQFAAALNKTDAEIDDVFINAQQLDAA